MRFRGVMLATALFATPLMASAQPIQGLYITGGAGLTFPGSAGHAIDPRFRLRSSSPG